MEIEIEQDEIEIDAGEWTQDQTHITGGEDIKDEKKDHTMMVNIAEATKEQLKEAMIVD